LRASAELALGRTDEAWADVKTALTIADSVKGEPFLISELVRIAVLQATLTRPVWEGLAAHQWSDAQLAELEQRLGGINMLEEYGHSIRGERGWKTTAWIICARIGKSCLIWTKTRPPFPG